jgi:starch-binding outer membrane protein, SusD/RagB family
MFLTRGEANLRKGGAPIGNVDPLADINKVRELSGASPLSGITGEDFVEERLRELGFEGDRLWTLKRLKLDVDGRPFNDDKLVLPIPQRETDVNSNLTQNPGY